MLTAFVAGALWMALLGRWLTVGLRGPINFALFALAAGVTLDIDVVGARLASWVGVANVDHLAKHLLVVVAAFAATEVVRRIGVAAEPRRFQHRVLVVVGMLVVGLAVLFLLADSPPATRDLASAYVADDALFAYRVLWLAALGGALLRVMELARRHAAAAERHWMRPAMSSIAAAAGFGLIYVVLKAGYLGLWKVGVQDVTVARWIPLASAAAKDLSLLLLAMGVVSPAALRMPALRRLHDSRSDRRLMPLWAELTSVVPSVVLADRSAMDAGARLRRTVIEIHDAALTILTGHGGIAGTTPQLRELAQRIVGVGETRVFDLHTESRRLASLAAGHLVDTRTGYAA